MKTEMIVALDVASAREVREVVRALGAEVNFFKVGLELFTCAGPAALAPLQAAGKRVFLDLKLHDIPRTVARAVTAAAAQGVDLLTVHAGGGTAMLAAAAQAAGDSGPNVVAVTALTSLDEADLRSVGVARGLQEHIAALAELAVNAGVDGLVCSPQELRLLRRNLGDAPILVAPGVRPAGAEHGDQKRVATPAQAAQAGATYIVVGRPVLEAPDPAAAARRIRAELNAQ